MHEPRLLTIGDLCNTGIVELQTGPFGSQLHAHDYVAKGVPVVPTEAIGDRRIDHEKLPHISNQKADELSRHRLRAGDILFARRGVQATGQSALVRGAEAGFICGTGAIRLRVKSTNEIIRSNFLSHVFMDRPSREWIRHNAIGATMPNLNEGIIRRFAFFAPPVDDQDKIVDLLDALDDKIELNRRMNETLEAVARAIFKDWFVDFGPTRAKLEGRAPYLAPEVWSLFPDSLNEGGKPDGWNPGSLSDVASLNPESWSRTTYPEAVDYVDLSNTKWGMIEAITPYPSEAAPSRAQRILRPGDTIVGTVRPGNGSYAYVSAQGLTGSTGFAVLRPQDQIFREVVFLAATAKENIDRLAHLADGGAYPAVRPELVAATELVAAPERLFAAFSATTSALIDRAEANKQEISTLAATRDFLLPRLMSGEIRVRDAEKAVEAVV